MKRLFETLAVLFMLLVSGCGQSGPLYLPGNPSEVQEAPTPTTEDEDDGDDAEN